MRIREIELEHEKEMRLRALEYEREKLEFEKVSKGAKIRNRCIQVPHLTKDTNEKVTNSQ